MSRGRPEVNQREVKRALKLFNSQAYSVNEISDMTNIDRATICRLV